MNGDEDDKVEKGRAANVETPGASAVGRAGGIRRGIAKGKAKSTSIPIAQEPPAESGAGDPLDASTSEAPLVGSVETVDPAESLAPHDMSVQTPKRKADVSRPRRPLPTGLRLVLGNRNYSSWSLRPWILMRHAGLSFEEIRIPLMTPEGERLMDELCPAGKVPVLNDGPLVLWDSLAICEYIADKAREVKASATNQAGGGEGRGDVSRATVSLWPEAVERRAEARAMSAEMHAGFAHLRAAMPMNCRRVVRGFKPDFNTRTDIDRLVDLFESALSRSRARGEGPWLFGQYSVADAMFAPIASRFRTYGISVPPDTRAWIDETLDDPPMREWYEMAAAETEVLESSEVPDC